MSDETREFTTQSTPGGEPFEGKIDEATEYYRKMIYCDRHYYGPAMDAVLHEAIRRSFVATGSVSIEELCEHFGGPHPSEFDVPVAEGLRGLIEDAATLPADVSRSESGR